VSSTNSLHSPIILSAIAVDDKGIAPVEYHKHLGVVLSTDCKWSVHINYIIEEKIHPDKIQVLRTSPRCLWYSTGAIPLSSTANNTVGCHSNIKVDNFSFVWLRFTNHILDNTDLFFKSIFTNLSSSHKLYNRRKNTSRQDTKGCYHELFIKYMQSSPILSDNVLPTRFQYR
jgi:hypothetical protein